MSAASKACRATRPCPAGATLQHALLAADMLYYRCSRHLHDNLVRRIAHHARHREAELDELGHRTHHKRQALQLERVLSTRQ